MTDIKEIESKTSSCERLLTVLNETLIGVEMVQLKELNPQLKLN